MAAFELYGFQQADFQAARKAVEQALGVEFIRRENPRMGEFFGTRPGPGNEHFVLRRNLDPAGKEPAEDQFPDYAVILYVNCTARSEEIRASLEAMPVRATHLRSGR